MARWLRRAGLLALGVGVALGATALTAHADTTAEHLQVTGSLGADGVLKVDEVLTFPGGTAPATVVQRLANTRPTLANGYYQYTFTGISAAADGQDLGATVSSDGGYTVVSVPTSKASGKPVTISYTVTGAVQKGPQGEPIVTWRMLQGLSVPVDKVEGSIVAPAIMTSMDCEAGVPGTSNKCKLYAGATHDYPNPSFIDGPRGPGETVTLSVNYPAGAVAITEQLNYRWTLDRAFSLTWLTVLAALGALLLGGLALFVLHRRYGTDGAAGAPIPVAVFEPVGEGAASFRVLDEVRPGHIGTVADERVDPIDVTGTLLDLATRGYLRIHELPNAAHQPLDWRFERLDKPTDDLRRFELLLLDAVAPVGGEKLVSQLSGCVGPVIGDVQGALYDDVVERGWFVSRPDAARSSWGRLGWVAVAVAVLATVVLAGFTTWGLVGLALVALAVGFVWVAERMPRRTTAGAGLLGGLTVLSGVLQTQPTTQVPKDDPYDEISRILPYAVVLGGKERWLQALADADDDPDVADPTDLSWYHAPRDWHLSALPASIRAFVTSVQGELFSR